MSMIGFPLLLIPLALYNIFVFLMPGVEFTSQIASVTLMSRVVWTPTFGDALIATAIVLLLLEIVKASRPGTRYLTDHMLSLLVFIAAAAEFTLLAPFGTSTFFLLTVLTAVEFLACVAIGLRHRSRSAVGQIPEPVRQEPALPPPASYEPMPASIAPAKFETPGGSADRKIAEWNVADLVAGDDAKAKQEDAAKPAGSDASAPKP